jgi:hypothetical protein
LSALRRLSSWTFVLCCPGKIGIVQAVQVSADWTRSFSSKAEKVRLPQLWVRAHRTGRLHHFWEVIEDRAQENAFEKSRKESEWRKALEE